jgi:hypothetical protein
MAHTNIGAAAPQMLGAAPAAEVLRAELQHMQHALADVRRELAELRREQAAASATSALLLPAWISAAGVTCCVALVAVALQAAVGVRAASLR